MTDKLAANVKKDTILSILDKYHLQKKHKILGCVVISDKELLKELLNGLCIFPVNFLVVSDANIKNSVNIFVAPHIDEKEIEICDFILCDHTIQNLEKYFSHGVVPIVEKDNYLSSLLTEFNPIKNEGNAFLYDTLNKWHIFYAFVRYLENSKFPFDNKNLVANVCKI